MYQYSQFQVPCLCTVYTYKLTTNQTHYTQWFFQLDQKQTAINNTTTSTPTTTGAHPSPSWVWWGSPPVYRLWSKPWQCRASGQCCARGSTSADSFHTGRRRGSRGEGNWKGGEGRGGGVEARGYKVNSVYIQLLQGFQFRLHIAHCDHSHDFSITVQYFGYRTL